MRDSVYSSVERLVAKTQVAESIGMRMIQASPGDGRSILVQFFQETYGSDLPEGLPQNYKGRPIFYEEFD